MQLRACGSGARLLLLLLTLALSTRHASAQKLSIQGDKFAVDGSPRFLVFMSFFGAMGAPNIADDLKFLAESGFDGVRIWPNLNTGPQLMSADGSLRPEGIDRLKFVLDRARDVRLVVDVSFTHEHITGMSMDATLTGIVNTANALRGYDNVLFDLQNERNVGDRRYMSEEDVDRIYRAVKAADPSRITFADNSLGEEWGPQYAADFTARLGLDVTALHESRKTHWHTLPFLQGIVDTMRKNGRPVYLQEPNSTRDRNYETNDRAEYYLQAVANAKLAGAAAWCFHTMVAASFRDGGPATVEERLRRFKEPEWDFVTALRPQINLRASNGTSYVGADGGGGGAIRADRPSGGPWETMRVTNLGGGPLVSGDRIALMASDGTHYWQAIGGGGSGLRANTTAIGPYETFIIERAGGGLIRHGELVTLKASETPFYVMAESGGGGAVNVNSANRSVWETFMLLYVSPHSSSVAPGQLPFRQP